jgi:teichuronic acid biosynthesis glycosyltransferase TuaC
MESNTVAVLNPEIRVRSQGSPKVLAVIPGEGEGMSFIFARRQVESLARVGVSVQVFYLKSRTSPRGLFTELRRLKVAIKRYSPDVVHAHYGTITSFLCACSTRRPLAITFRGSDLNSDPGIGFLRARLGFLLSQISAWRASIIICTSVGLRRRLWWKKSKSVVLPSGVDLTLFKPIDKGECRKILGWRPDERVVLFNAGKAPLLKGLPLAREAVWIAEKTLGPMRLFELCGNTVPDRIPIYLNAADCLALASQCEGSPNILKEALACNLPVVSVHVGDVAERLEGVFPSQIVPRNAASLAKAICETIERPQRSNGREKIQDCSEEKIAELLRDIYWNVCDPLARIIKL